jgi:hypothetical protein
MKHGNTSVKISNFRSGKFFFVELQQHGSCAEIFLGLQFDGNY